MMLDAKRPSTSSSSATRPTRRRATASSQNRIYQQISNAMAGSQEYMAMEKLYELHHEGRYDLLVLDTPPTRNALDFLDAPRRMTQFIEGRSLQVFMKPTGLRGTRSPGAAPPSRSRRPEADHRHRPARRPVRVLPGLRRHGRRLPGARQAGQRAARRPAHHLPGRLRPAGRADRRGRLLPPQAGRGEAARSAAWSSTRSTTRPSACGRRRRTCAPSWRSVLGDEDLAERVARELRRLPGAGRARRAQHRPPGGASCAPAA